MISIIACKSINGVIGKNNDLVFKSLKTDMKWFKEYTKHKYVIMGRKTWESIPTCNRPLKDRINIVITSDLDYLVPDGCTAMTIDELKRFIGNNNTGYKKRTNEFVIIGGASLYKELINVADMIFLTTIQTYADGDKFFPCFDESKYLTTCLEVFNENINGVEIPASIVMYEKI